MKNLLVMCLFTFIATHLLANNPAVPLSTSPEIIYDSSEVLFSIQPTDLMLAVSYNDKSNDFAVSSNAMISFITVINSDNIVEFQMPISSKTVHLALNDFDKGTYDLELNLNGEILSSELTIK